MRLHRSLNMSPELSYPELSKIRAGGSRLQHKPYRKSELLLSDVVKTYCVANLGTQFDQVYNETAIGLRIAMLLGHLSTCCLRFA